jgi:hypothetical protein
MRVLKSVNDLGDCPKVYKEMSWEETSTSSARRQKVGVGKQGRAQSGSYNAAVVSSAMLEWDKAVPCCPFGHEAVESGMGGASYSWSCRCGLW